MTTTSNNNVRLSATVSIISVLASIALAAWCASFIHDITPWWRLTFFTIPPIVTAWIARAIHNAAGKYAQKKIELLFCACTIGMFMGIFTICCAFLCAGPASGNALDIPAYTCLGITVLSMAIALWKDSASNDDCKHLIYACRILTIGFVLAWIFTGVDYLWVLPEWIITVGQFYMAAGMGYFFVSIVAYFIKIGKK